MKVLFILPRMVVGGIEHVRLILASHFLSEGVECKLAVRTCSGGLVDRARSLLPVIELAPRGMHQFVPKLITLLRNERPTHVITAFPDIGLLAWIAMKLAGRKAVWVHSVHLTHASIAAKPGFRGRIRHHLDNIFLGFNYRRADKVVTVSEALREEVIRLFGIAPEKVETIYNPVIPESELRDRPIERDNPARPYTIIAMGRLAKEKGFDVLIEAMEMTPQPWHLEIFGAGPELRYLEDLVSSKELNAQVDFRGNTELPFDILRTADLFVLPSRSEGLGNVVIEAMACQCQIVATDCCVGPSEILKKGRLGQLVPIENPGALSEAIVRSMTGSFLVAPAELLERAKDFSRVRGCEHWLALLREIDAPDG